MTLENIIQVYVRCANNFEVCPVYQKLLADECRHRETEVGALRAAS